MGSQEEVGAAPGNRGGGVGHPYGGEAGISAPKHREEVDTRWQGAARIREPVVPPGDFAVIIFSFYTSTLIFSGRLPRAETQCERDIVVRNPTLDARAGARERQRSCGISGMTVFVIS